MNTKLMALDYINRARRCLKESKTAFDEEDYPITVRRAQECVELSLKAVLRSIAIEYPREHDMSKALEMLKEKFPDWFSLKIPEFKRTSRDLSKKEVPQCTVTKQNSSLHQTSSAGKMRKKRLHQQKKFSKLVTG
jgi:HEPN domain-containing protein